MKGDSPTIRQCCDSYKSAPDHAPNCLLLTTTTKPPDGPRPSVQSRQVGGTHYTNNKNMQPWDIWEAFDLDPWEANAIKYLLRHRLKGGVQDLEKAKHYIDAIIQYNYDAGGRPKNGDPRVER